MKKRLIVALTGASGACYGVKLLEQLSLREDIEIHLIVSHWAQKTLVLETEISLDTLCQYADFVYSEEDLAANIASGSFKCYGMVVLPCSMKTLASIACGLSNTLTIRAADVTIKERRRLILGVRETPLNAIHLNNMLKLAQLGVIIMPPVPAFYLKPKSIDDLISHYVTRVIDVLDIESEDVPRWSKPENFHENS